MTMFLMTLENINGMRWHGAKKRRIITAFVSLFFSAFSIVVMVYFFVFRGFLFLMGEYSLIDWLPAFLLLFGEMFLLFHSFGFALSMIKSLRYPLSSETSALKSEPFVAVLVPTYSEPLELVERTLRAALEMDYGNKKIFWLDDTEDPGQVQRSRKLAEELGVNYIRRPDNRFQKAGALNYALTHTEAGLSKYFAVFDADMAPEKNYLKVTVPYLEGNYKLALVQTPQSYGNLENVVTRAAYTQQTIFFGPICEGKNVSNAIFCCGTGFTARTGAFKSVGFFVTDSVTEDFATSKHIHSLGWKTKYHNEVLVRGVGPSSLLQYFKQQGRWSFGTIGMIKLLFKSFLRKPACLTVSQWWEYFVSSTWYLCGLAWFCLMIPPIAFLLFGARPIIVSLVEYFYVFVPYITFTMIHFFGNMWRRGQSIKNLFLAQSLSFLTFPIYISSLIALIRGKKRKFVKTPKEGAASLPLRSMLPQVFMICLSAVAVGRGIGLAYLAFLMQWTERFAEVVINILWASLHLVLLCQIIKFNKTLSEKKIHG
jgi:cellulose synthase (UDP-forming)